MFQTHFGTNLLWVLMDIRIPSPIINVTLDVPPLLIRGKGTPTTGRIPIVMPILTKTYMKKVRLMLEASNLEKRSCELIAINNPLATINK